MWGPLTNQEFNKWEKHPIETLHAEFCKSILKVHRCAIHNACRAELGQYPLITKIQKRAIKFWKHLKSSDPHSHHYKALQYQELSKDTCPLTQLVLSLSSPDPHTHTNTLLTPQDQYRKAPEIRINQIGKTIKQNYISHWKTQTKTQSKMQFYLALNRNYDLAPYFVQCVRKCSSVSTVPCSQWGHSLFSLGSQVCLCLPTSMASLCTPSLCFVNVVLRLLSVLISV